MPEGEVVGLHDLGRVERDFPQRRGLEEMGAHSVGVAHPRCGRDGVTGVFFPHGIGHLLGLQVHDVGGRMADPSGAERPRPTGHPYLRMTRDLEPGCVVTIEPGLYFIEMLLAEAHRDERRKLIDWNRVDALRGCGGVRVEDNVVAMPDGPRNLTREAFAAST